MSTDKPRTIADGAAHYHARHGKPADQPGWTLEALMGNPTALGRAKHAAARGDTTATKALADLANATADLTAQFKPNTSGTDAGHGSTQQPAPDTSTNTHIGDNT